MSGRLSLVATLGLAFLITGCPAPDDTGNTGKSDPVSDADEDGFTVEDGDCDDANDAIYPGATDTWYDGIDSDCGFDSDYDADADGFDSSAESENGEDCDDTDDTVNPDAEDAFYDGVDSDCDEASDFDADGDGHDSVDYDGDDCDDNDAAFSPSVDEIWYDGIDQDCSGGSDYDADQDGEDALAHGGLDCDDSASDVYPTADEVWYDGIDQDCYPDNDDDADGDGFSSADEGGTDCDDTDATVNTDAVEVWYDNVDQDCDAGSDFDADGDGYDSVDFSGTDCNDALDTINPDAVEVCDSGVDNNCDGAADDADSNLDSASTNTFYADTDNDSFGDANSTDEACEAPSGYVADNTDCNDTSNLYNPNAAETDCNDPEDYNCDGATGYSDADNDGFSACTECDDTDPLVNPDATEVCDGIDNDCVDGVDFDSSGAYLGSEYYADVDIDGYGDASNSLQSCSTTVPSGYVTDDTDCNDGNNAVNPGAVEVCDLLDTDEDCDTFADDDDPEGATGTSDWYADADGDGYGDENATAVAYCDPPSTNVSQSNDDCNDGAGDGPAINPGATETPQDGEDSNCDNADGNWNADELIAGELVITEVMANPTGADADKEWMEIYVNSTLACHASATGACIDLVGLVISDGTTSESFTVGSEFLVENGDYLVVALDSVSTTNGGLPGVDYVLSTGSSVFTNGGDQIDLSNTTFGVIDTVDYSDSSFPAVSEGISLALDPTGTAATNNDGANWCDDQVGAYGDGDLGSPGSVNAACPTAPLACGQGGTCSYATDIHPLWSSNTAASCTVCHGTSGGLTLSGTASSTLNSELSGLYTSGDHASSRLWKKISGTTAGTRMPQGGGSFSQLEQDMIADWIDQGANP